MTQKFCAHIGVNEEKIREGKNTVSIYNIYTLYYYYLFFSISPLIPFLMIYSPFIDPSIAIGEIGNKGPRGHPSER
jgi:hypothetical protein